MKKVFLGCLGAALLIVVVGGTIVWLWLFRELPVLDATLSLPSEAEVDSTIYMVVTATNSHGKSITLDSIDIDDSFLTGFQVISIDPKPKDTTHVPIINQRSWEFGAQVPPQESLSVTFELRAVSQGHFSGDVDVCNPNQDFTTLLADVVVKKGLSNQAINSDKKWPRFARPFLARHCSRSRRRLSAAVNGPGPTASTRWIAPRKRARTIGWTGPRAGRSQASLLPSIPWPVSPGPLGFEMKNLLVMIFIAATASGCATGICTDRLIRANRMTDPQIKQYHAAYAHRGEIILEYTVLDTDQRIADRYWAELHVDMLPDRMRPGDYTIHRRPLRESKRKRMEPIPLIDRQHDTNQTDAVPAVFVNSARRTELNVRYRNPETGKTEWYQDWPRDRFIPAARYPKVIAVWPFAFVGDLVTWPFVWPWAIADW